MLTKVAYKLSSEEYTLTLFKSMSELTHIWRVMMGCLIYCSLSTNLINAQEPQLYGLVSATGQYKTGGLISIKTDGSDFQTHGFYVPFTGKEADDYDGLEQAPNGKLYGMTYRGGIDNEGVLFEYDPVTGNTITKVDFTGNANGRHPKGSLMLANNGQLYGMTGHGGNTDNGVLFEYTPGATNVVVKYDFIYSHGRNPKGSLVEASNGKLYGMTSSAGINNNGVLFEYTPGATSTITKFHFDGINGRAPSGTLIEASNGKLYGVTGSGGNNDYGTLFEYTPGSNTIAPKFLFDITNGRLPVGTLLESGNGKLYGMALLGGDNNLGVIYEYTLGADTVIKKISFNNTNGSHPSGTLIKASNGKLYGMTLDGGSNGFGILFQYTPGTNTTVTKVNFGGDNGKHPRGSLMVASNGKLYGMTREGGKTGDGVLFEYTVGDTTIVVVADCNLPINGNNPYGSPVQSATNGRLYGMTRDGGSSNFGVLFEHTPGTDTTATKVNFDNANGQHPHGSLVEATNEKLYGMTRFGGSNDLGVLFEYSPGANTTTTKFNFDNTNGKHPRGSLIEANNGKLYGMTREGGSDLKGVIFEYSPGDTTTNTKFNFTGTTSGRNPLGDLAEAVNGKLYGLTRYGGNNDYGVLFEYTPGADTTITKIHFEVTNGREPYGSLVKATNGKLYGMTRRGGSNNLGVLFEYTPGATTTTNKFSFDDTNGSEPLGSLFEASNGKLYGMTNLGASYNHGVIFEYIPGATSVTVIKDLNVDDGIYPLFGHLIELDESILTDNGWSGNLDKTVPQLTAYTSSNHLIISTAGLNMDRSTLQLIDMQGRTVASFDDLNSTDGLISIPISNIGHGAYIVKFNTSGQQLSQKIIF